MPRSAPLLPLQSPIISPRFSKKRNTAWPRCCASRFFRSQPLSRFPFSPPSVFSFVYGSLKLFSDLSSRQQPGDSIQQNGSPANRTAAVFVFKGIRCFHHLIRYPTSTSDPPFLISPCIKHGQNPRRSAAGLSFRQPPGPFREPFRLTKGVRFFCLSAETSIGVIHLSESIAQTVSRPLYGRRSFHEAQRHMGLTFSFPIFPPDDFRLLSGAHPRVMLLSCGTAVKPPGSCLFFPFCGRQKHTHF